MSTIDWTKNLDLAKTPISHKWDAKKHSRHWKSYDQKLGEVIAKLNFQGRALIGLAAGERIIHRFMGHDPYVERAQQYLEAAYVARLDFKYLKAPDFENGREEVAGNPVTHPLFLTKILMYEVIEAIHTAVEGDDIYIVSLVRLARHVSPKSRAVTTWYKDLATRLEQIANRDAPTEVLPREILNAEFNYIEGERARLIQAFLDRVDPDETPYLRTSEEMMALGFEGTPYEIQV